MGRLKKYAKESKKELHQYPWKVDVELFALWDAYSDSLNMSVNEALTILVKEELKDFIKDLSEEEQEKIVSDFLKKRKKDYVKDKSDGSKSVSVRSKGKSLDK